MEESSRNPTLVYVAIGFYVGFFVCAYVFTLSHIHKFTHLLTKLLKLTCTQTRHLPDQRKALIINIVLDKMKKIDPKDPKRIRQVHMYVSVYVVI